MKLQNLFLVILIVALLSLFAATNGYANTGSFTRVSVATNPTPLPTATTEPIVEFDIVINGVRYPASEADKYSELHLLTDATSIAEGFVYGFTTEQERYDFAVRNGIISPEANPTPIPTPTSGAIAGAEYSAFQTACAAFFDLNWYGGTGFVLATSFPDLRTRSFDNRISSVINQCSRPIVLYDFANYRGASLLIPPRTEVPVLGWFRWNNRTSSIRFI